jgi:predicted O-methyltransferase YrrM
MGIGTAYLAAGCPEAHVITVEADTNKSAFAQREISNLNLRNVGFINDDFDEFLSRQTTLRGPLLIFIDGNHTREATLRYFNFFRSNIHPDSILVFDDINWSEEMVDAWKEITHAAEVSIRLNIFFMGIVLFRKGIVKQNFLVRY